MSLSTAWNKIKREPAVGLSLLVAILSLPIAGFTAFAPVILVLGVVIRFLVTPNTTADQLYIDGAQHGSSLERMKQQAADSRAKQANIYVPKSVYLQNVTRTQGTQYDDPPDPAAPPR